MRFDHTKMTTYIESWVQEVDDPLLNRAWEIVKECVNSHAIVDREEGQAAKLARTEAWRDWALAYDGDESTYTLFGLVHEFTSACPALEQDRMEEVMEQAVEMAKGTVKKPKRVKRKNTVPASEAPMLTLVVNNTLKENNDD